MKIYQAGWALGKRMLIPELSRRSMLRATAHYIAVPLAIDQVVTIVTFGKLNDEVQGFTVLAATIATIYGPSRSLQLFQRAASSPAAVMAAVRGAPIALALRGKASYKAAAAFMSRASLAVTPAVAGASRSITMSFKGYGDLIFSTKDGKLTVAGTTAFMASLIAGNGFLATSASVDLDDVLSGALQIMTATVAEIQAKEVDEIEEFFFKRDPLNLISSLPLLADSIARDFQYVSRQHIAAIAMSALSTDIDVKNGVFFDLFVDSEGDPVMSIDGTHFDASHITGISDEKDLKVVIPGDRTGEIIPPASIALMSAIQSMFGSMKEIKNVPFVKGDGGFLYSNPYSFSIGDDSFVVCLCFSEEGEILFKLFKGGWFSDASSNFSSASTRNFFESVLDKTISIGKDVADAVGDASDFLFSWMSNEPELKEAEAITAPSRLQTEPGAVVFYTFDEIEAIL